MIIVSYHHHVMTMIMHHYHHRSSNYHLNHCCCCHDINSHTLAHEHHQDSLRGRANSLRTSSSFCHPLSRKRPPHPSECGGSDGPDPTPLPFSADAMVGMMVAQPPNHHHHHHPRFVMCLMVTPPPPPPTCPPQPMPSWI